MIETLCAMLSAPLFADAAAGAAAKDPANETPRASDQPAASGPLRVCPANPRYFADGSGRAILLTGSHTWNNLADMGQTDPPERFDFDAYLDWMTARHHNFIRLWTWELVIWDTGANRETPPKRHYVTPLPWRRTGPGAALDGKPKFDLTQYDEEYFGRLRQRVGAAQRRGIYVSVMLFEGWGVQMIANGWAGHPFNARNNVNGVEADQNGDGSGVEVHELLDPKITALQEAYVRHVVETVNEFDNVLYEISNENHPASTEWQYHMIRFIKDFERAKAKQHPVGMTFQHKGGSNKTLFESPADWISPNHEGGYRDDPPTPETAPQTAGAAGGAGAKVILSDTDHLWGIGGNPACVWKSFLRGLNPLFMDPYDDKVLSKNFDPQRSAAIRAAMGHALDWSRRVDLTAMAPRNGLASTKFCLANPGREYLVYLPDGGGVTVDLSAAAGAVAVEWFDPDNGRRQAAPAVEGGASRELTAPFAGHAILYLTESEQ